MAAAEQETDYVNHVFMQHNPGFLVLYSFIKDALLSKVGVVSLEFGVIDFMASNASVSSALICWPMARPCPSTPLKIGWHMFPRASA